MSSDVTDGIIYFIQSILYLPVLILLTCHGNFLLVFAGTTWTAGDDGRGWRTRSEGETKLLVMFHSS